MAPQWRLLVAYVERSDDLGSFDCGNQGRLVEVKAWIRWKRGAGMTLPETRLFAASKVGLGALFCTLEMGLIERSIDVP
jgi:hypothetical protein